MSQIGSFALLLALALSAYSFLAELALPNRCWVGAAGRNGGGRHCHFRPGVSRSRRAVTSAFQDDFDRYIYHHSNRDLPAPYKFATLWSGQEGSLLFWSLLAAYGLPFGYGTRPTPGLPTLPRSLRQSRSSFYCC
jgi:cytochrome c-type biogenesis protein CcmF